MVFHLPRYYRICMLNALGGMLFGLDTGTIGPVTSMPSFGKSLTTSHLSATLHGILVATILIPAALSSLIAGTVADMHGRPRTIMFGAAVFGVGAAIECAANDIGAFVAGRIITGIGEGFFLSLLVVYICEISPAKTRGPLASLPQFGTTVGIASGYFISYGTSNIESSASWRVPLAFQSSMAFVFACTCVLMPPSPRWLVAKGRPGEASRVMDNLGIPRSGLEDPAVEVDVTVEDVAIITNDISLFRGILLTFKDLPKAFAKGARGRTALGCFMMAMQQFSGIDGVLYYAPLLFTQAGLSSTRASFFASGVSALVILGATIPATIFSDHWGRRPSMFIGGVGLGGSMTVIGSLYASGSVHAHDGVGRWVVIVAIYIFAIVYSLSWAVSFRIYASEIQPPKTRAIATSLAQSSNWFANFIVALTTPVFLSTSSSGVYFFFAACIAFTVLVCSIVMPETRGHDLDTIDAGFENHSYWGGFGGGSGGGDGDRRGRRGRGGVVMKVVSRAWTTSREIHGEDIGMERGGGGGGRGLSE